MGARGPIPFPSQVKARRGTLEKSREVSNQPVVDAAMPPKPSGLAEAAASLWDALAPTLHAAGLLTKADAPALARLVTYQAILNALLVTLDAGNLTQITTGGEAPSGDLKVALAIEEKVKALEDRFGLNPSARCRISVRRDDDAPQGEAQDFA